MAETTFDIAEVGEWMADCGIAEWFNYDDMGTFKYKKGHNMKGDVAYFIADPDEGKQITFTAKTFYRKHKDLIYEGKIEGYRLDWISFAMRLSGADSDEYDSNTTDAVLQNMLYGEVIYG